MEGDKRPPAPPRPSPPPPPVSRAALRWAGGWTPDCSEATAHVVDVEVRRMLEDAQREARASLLAPLAWSGRGR
jgi:hypothetical protein